MTQMETWTSSDAQKCALGNDGLIIIPLGSCEQHGPHAPLGTDTIICMEIAKRLAQRLNAVTLPPVWFSISDEHRDFAGTISIQPETLCNYLSDIILSLASSGFRKILVLNGHGTNESYFPIIQAQVQEAFSAELELLMISYWSALPKELQEYLGSLKWGLHANAYETSLISVIAPDTIKNVKISAHFPNVTGLSMEALDANLFRELIKGSNGVWGDPTQASIEKGQYLLSNIESTLAIFIANKFKLVES